LQRAAGDTREAVKALIIANHLLMEKLRASKSSSRWLHPFKVYGKAEAMPGCERSKNRKTFALIVPPKLLARRPSG
jgi:hypothetical protein